MWEQEGDHTCHLEKVVPGPLRPTGGDDDDFLRLIFPNLDQSSLEEGSGIGEGGHPCPGQQGVRGLRQQVTSLREPTKELVIQM